MAGKFEQTDDRDLDAWRGARVLPVDDGEHHSIHSYFNACPESPDGRWVLLFASTQPDGHVGQIVIVCRQSGERLIVADHVTVEDAHRQAYQQWCSGGRRIVYQDFHGQRWQIRSYEVASRQTRVLFEGCQLGWGQAAGDLVPIYGPHWAPGEHRNLLLLDVTTGRIHMPATITQICDQSPAWVRAAFDPAVASVFFPILSPNFRRVMFKLSQPAGGEFRSRAASKRAGLMVMDLDSGQLIRAAEHWGHPAWHPDSQTIITTPNLLIDLRTGTEERMASLPEWPGSHPSFHPGGRLILSDTYLRGEGVPRGWWAIALGDPRTGRIHHVHELHELPGGATSWRPPHPHPTFTPDGRRIYFNISAGRWTRLHVASIEERV